MVGNITWVSPYTSLIGFVLGFPMSIATYYEVFKTRHEALQTRQGMVVSDNCLEFVLDDGETVNVVPLETLHSLPKPGDIVLLPGTHALDPILPHAAYRISRVEHLYAPVNARRARPGQARLAKTVAHVDRLEHS